MTLSRMHLGMLGVASIFTGMISPVVRSGLSVFPFPLTDMQIYAYLILLILAIICVLLAVRSWSWTRVAGLITIVLIGYLFIVSWSGEVRTSSGLLAPSLSWGWLFLASGVGLLIASMFGDEIISEGPSLGDHWLGWLGSISILALTGVIMAISYIPGTERSRSHVLENMFGTGSSETRSGLTRSMAFSSIEKMAFDRASDQVSFFAASGTQMVSFPSGQIYDRLPYTTTTIGNTRYTVSANGIVSKDSDTIMGKAILPQDMSRAILMLSGSEIISLSRAGIRPINGEYTSIEDIIATREGEHSIWRSRNPDGYRIYRDGESITMPYHEISHISASSDGRSVMALIGESDGVRYIIKNDVKIEQIAPGYIEGTLRMNGTESLYAVERDGMIELIHNGTILDRKFDEIREVYLDTDGGGYAYFGRPLGESSYCIYTRYRGNLCGLTGYMNPRQAPDSSIVYAAMVDGAWGIYRNTSPIIRNTGYMSREDISRDYVFFDITNPSYYLFIRGSDTGYRLYKKGAWIDGTYKDVGLDVSFGYDYKIIMSIQDSTGWRLIEF
ncbi:hypothetical protein H7170_03105 [Candidatus Gracilibacteria bacterium]|nr:hypothetical protein [Candidatus Gracilibacteria bacterium]